MHHFTLTNNNIKMCNIIYKFAQIQIIDNSYEKREQQIIIAPRWYPIGLD